MTGFKSFIASVLFLILVIAGLVASVGAIENGMTNGWFFIVCGVINIANSGLAGFYAWSYIYKKYKEKEEAKKEANKKAK